jgi:hypothetical protein
MKTCFLQFVSSMETAGFFQIKYKYSCEGSTFLDILVPKKKLGKAKFYILSCLNFVRLKLRIES